MPGEELVNDMDVYTKLTAAMCIYALDGKGLSQITCGLGGSEKPPYRVFPEAVMRKKHKKYRQQRERHREEEILGGH